MVGVVEAQVGCAKVYEGNGGEGGRRNGGMMQAGKGRIDGDVAIVGKCCHYCSDCQYSKPETLTIDWEQARIELHTIHSCHNHHDQDCPRR